MIELIKVAEHNGQKVVSARELHQFLEIRTEFAKWCSRMFEYSFIENEDYILLEINPEELSSNLTIINRGPKPKDYGLTIACAKQITMLQRTEKGHQARLYFLECEKQLKQFAAPRNENEMILATIQLLQTRIAEDKKLIEKQAPLAAYTSEVLRSEDLATVTEIAKALGMTARQLNAKLHEMGIQFKQGNMWHLYQQYQDKKYTKQRTDTFVNSEGKVFVRTHTCWTQRGKAFLMWKLGILTDSIQSQVLQISNSNQLPS